jgi:predicted PurR-regulated permease PerM
MNERTRNSPEETNDTLSGTQAASWSAPFVGGLIVGVIIALVAAVRRLVHVGGQEAPAESTEVTDGLASTPAPAPGTTVHPATPAAGKPPSAVAQASGSEGASGQQGKPQRTGTERPKPPQTAKPASPSLAGPTRWQEPTKYVVGVGLFLAVLFVLYLSRSVIPTVIVAALLALIVHPIIGFLQRRLKLSKGLSIAITYLLIVGLLVLIPLLVIPTVIDAINDLINLDFQAWADSAAQSLQSLSDRVARIPVVNYLLTPLLQSVGNALQGISTVSSPDSVSYDAAVSGLIDRLSQTLSIITAVLGPVVSAVISVAFMLLISLHLSLSGDRILEGFPQLLPSRYASEITALVDRIGGVWVSFLRGQFALMVIIGVMVWLGNAILGNRYPLLLGIISGILEIIPNIGPALALIPGVGFALIFGSGHFAMEPLTFALVVLVFYLLVQVVENQVIVPYVLGGELEVPPLAVILGVMVGGTVAGILGVLLATPFIATARELFRYLYDKILEPPEQPQPEEPKPTFLDSIGNRIRNIRIPFRRRSAQPPLPDTGAE